MKKKLLYLTSIVLFSVSAINAQTTIWDIGNNSTTLNGVATTGDFPVGTAFLSETMIKSLGIFPGSATTFGAIGVQAGSGFSDSYTAANRFPTGGASAFTGALPTSRYLYFNVSGACTIKVWFKGGNSTTTRALFVSDGTTQLGSGGPSVNGAAIIITATATAAGKYYVYCDNGNNIYKIEVTGATVNTPALSTKSFRKELNVTVYAKNKNIFLSNIKSSTKVEVYNVLGVLVKSTKVDADTSLDINSGVYIVKAKSADGEKAVKVIVQ